MPRSDQEAGDRQAYLPDFCSARAVLLVVVIAELVATILTLASVRGGESFLLALSTNSLFVLWVSLTSAAVLCAMRGRLHAMDVTVALALTFLLLQLVTIGVSEAAWWLDRSYRNAFLQSADHASFLGRNLAISALVSAMALRYFYVAGEWRRSVVLQARARVRALQARIRPHFLFNSMNTIAALIRRDPERAEEAVEDLSDLFRATLGEGESLIPLGQEIEVARVYERMERLRLGDRLKIVWDVEQLPMDANIPALTIQPLLENAIYHGIEPLPGGGTVSIVGERNDGELQLTLSNPRPADGEPQREGHRLALDNIRQRLALAYGRRGGIEVEEHGESYRVILHFPARSRHA